MRRAAGYLAATVVVVAAFAVGFVITQSEQQASQAAPQRTSDPSIRLIDEVRDELDAAYYRWIHPDVLARPTVDGILDGLEDPHTEVLTATEFESLRDRTDGTYSGIGLTVGPASGGLVVTSAYPGPAKSAGIEPGDVIVRIDGAIVADKPFESALTLIKGQPGTVVRLRVRRPPQKEAFDVEVVRKEIAVPPISARLMRVKNQKVAYIRIFSFSADAADQVTATAKRLVAKGATGAIIDLRDNPGGLLSQAVDVASIFIADGAVCHTAGLHEEEHIPRHRLSDAAQAAAGRARELGQRKRCRDRRRRPRRPQSRDPRRDAHVREGLCADRRAAPERAGAQAHDREVRDARRGGYHRPGPPPVGGGR